MRARKPDRRTILAIYAGLRVFLAILLVPALSAWDLPFTSQRTRGDNDFRDGNYELAIGHYRKALQDDEDSDWELLYNLGTSYYHSGMWDDAVEALEASSQLADQHGVGSEILARINHNLGLAHLQRDDCDNAVPALAKANELEPDDEDISRNFSFAETYCEEQAQEAENTEGEEEEEGEGDEEDENEGQSDEGESNDETEVEDQSDETDEQTENQDSSEDESDEEPEDSECDQGDEEGGGQDSEDQSDQSESGDQDQQDESEQEGEDGKNDESQGQQGDEEDESDEEGTDSEDKNQGEGDEDNEEQQDESESDAGEGEGEDEQEGGGSSGEGESQGGPQEIPDDGLNLSDAQIDWILDHISDMERVNASRYFQNEFSEGTYLDSETFADFIMSMLFGDTAGEHYDAPDDGIDW